MTGFSPKVFAPEVEAELRNYLKTFTQQERIAHNTAQEMKCCLCDASIGFCDVMNYYDFVQVTCPNCRLVHDKTFLQKRDEMRKKEKKNG